jgi:YHS domain-containing protein
MHVQDIMYYLFWAGLFFVMMRFGCGAHIMGHGHHHDASATDEAPRTSVPSTLPDQVTDPVCKMTLQVSAAKTAVHSGQTYYFCSSKCRETFEAAPETYAKSGGVAAFKKEHQHGC